MKLLRSLIIVAFALVTMTTTTTHAAQIVLNQNAIVNPGAESGPGSATGNDIYALPGWTTTGNFTAVQFGASAAPVPSLGLQFGLNFFSGGPNNPTNTATQIIDVSNISASIDARSISFVLSGYFGGYLAQNDNATLFATFFNGSNVAISISPLIGGFNSTARNNITTLIFDSGGGFIPVGTRSVQITLQMTRTEGFYNDGYADNLSFVASSVGLAPLATPEPFTVTLAGLGISALLLLRRASGN